LITFLFATRNRHKVKELRRLLKGVPVRLLSLDQFPELRSAQEDGATFRANALKKAVQTSRSTILPVLAEDSGLEVRALGGRPGVRSARFAGSTQNSSANVAKLLRSLARFPKSRRQARFVCCMAVAIGGKNVRTFEGTCPGSIGLRAAGRTGFGYDPVFVPRGFHHTLSQLGPGIKDGLSHRSKAAVKFRKWAGRFKTGP